MKTDTNNRPLMDENMFLKAEVQLLCNEITALKQKLSCLLNHPTLARGMRGESIIAQCVSGVLTQHNSTYDVTVNGTQSRLEVKYSGLNASHGGRGSPDKGNLRWGWAKPFGETGNKLFERLILVGDKDPRYLEQYKDAESPYTNINGRERPQRIMKICC